MRPAVKSQSTFTGELADKKDARLIPLPKRWSSARTTSSPSIRPELPTATSAGCGRATAAVLSSSRAHAARLSGPEAFRAIAVKKIRCCPFLTPPPHSIVVIEPLRVVLTGSERHTSNACWTAALVAFSGRMVTPLRPT